MILYNFYPQSNLDWIKRITLLAYGKNLRDLKTKEIDDTIKSGINFHFDKQGNLRIEYQYFSEFWLGEQFTGGFFNTYGEVQITNWLHIYGLFNIGNRIYYSQTDPFLGKGMTADFKLTVQPGTKLTQFFEYQYQSLNKININEKVYDISIFISKTTYQFNKHLFLRAIAQYDSYRKTLLIDALVSYELIPGSVIQIGYGSFYENQYWQNNSWMRNNPLGEYYQTNQSVFIKVSYLFQY